MPGRRQQLERGSCVISFAFGQIPIQDGQADDEQYSGATKYLSANLQSFTLSRPSLTGNRIKLGSPVNQRVNDMKKNRIKTILIPLVSVSLLGAATASHAYGGGCDYRGGGNGAYGQKSHDMGRPNGGMKVERLAHKLNLTDGQQEQLKVIIEASRTERDALREKMQNNRAALREAMSSDNTASVRSLADQKGDLVADLTVLRANNKSQIASVLTPEQQKDFFEMKDHRPGRR